MYGCIGVLVYWCIGVLVYWCIGVLVIGVTSSFHALRGMRTMTLCVGLDAERPGWCSHAERGNKRYGGVDVTPGVSTTGEM